MLRMYTLYILECDTQTCTFIRNSTIVHASPTHPPPPHNSDYSILILFWQHYIIILWEAYKMR